MRRLPRRVFEFYWGQGIADDVPALTYYLVLSLAPFALGLAALHALLLQNVVSALQVAEQVNRFLPNALHGDVQNLIVGTREDSPRLIALAIVAMLWTTSGAIGVIERVESRMLDCPRHDVVTGRLRNIALGALVAAMVVVAVAVAPVMRDAAGAVGQVLPGGVLLAINTAGSIAAFTAVYRWAPRSRLRWRSAARGALPAGVAVQGIPTIVGLYVGATAGFAAVRLFLLLAIILLGLYIMAMVMLVGAGLAVRSEVKTRGRETAHAPGRPERMAPSRQARQPGTVA
jgi:YihY family inner membrane protein